MVDVEFFSFAGEKRGKVESRVPSRLPNKKSFFYRFKLISFRAHKDFVRLNSGI